MFCIVQIQRRIRGIRARKSAPLTLLQLSIAQPKPKTFAAMMYDFSEGKTCFGNFFQHFSNACLLISIVMTIVNTIPEIMFDVEYDKIFDYSELFFSIVFTLEYVINVLGALGNHRYR